MYVLLRVDNPLLNKVIEYLKRNKVWYKLFSEKIYETHVTAEDRIAANHRSRNRGQINPPQAWETCASCRNIWDWDNMGRGPYPATVYDIKRGKNGKAPPGKGYIINRFGDKQRVAGDCANPSKLSYMSCPMWCPNYEPTTIEGLIYLAEYSAKIHRDRADQLYRQIDFLKKTDKDYEEVVASGKIWMYRDQQFWPTLVDPDE